MDHKTCLPHDTDTACNTLSFYYTQIRKFYCIHDFSHPRSRSFSFTHKNNIWASPFYLSIKGFDCCGVIDVTTVPTKDLHGEVGDLTKPVFLAIEEGTDREQPLLGIVEEQVASASIEIEILVDLPCFKIFSIPELFCLPLRMERLRLDLGMEVTAIGLTEIASGASPSVLPCFKKSSVSCLDTFLFSDGVLLISAT